MKVRLFINAAIPIIAPRVEPIMVVTATPGHPTKVPIMAISFMSPPPIPPRLNIAIRKKSPPPASRPIIEAFGVIWFKAKEAAIPTAIPGRVIISGII